MNLEEAWAVARIIEYYAEKIDSGLIRELNALDPNLEWCYFSGRILVSPRQGGSETTDATTKADPTNKSSSS